MTSAVEITTETEHAVLLILPLHPNRTSVDSSVTDKKTELDEAEVQDSAAFFILSGHSYHTVLTPAGPEGHLRMPFAE